MIINVHPYTIGSHKSLAIFSQVYPCCDKTMYSIRIKHIVFFKIEGLIYLLIFFYILNFFHTKRLQTFKLDS